VGDKQGSPPRALRREPLNQRLLRSALITESKKKFIIEYCYKKSSLHFCGFSGRVLKNMVSYWIFWLPFVISKITVRIVTTVVFFSGPSFIHHWILEDVPK
jgi:hypothetical protein